MAKKAILFFIFFCSIATYGQDRFQKLKNELEYKIEYSQYKAALDIINRQQRNRLTNTQNAELDVMKVKLLIEFGLYEEALKLSQTLISNPNLTPEQRIKTLVERELIFEINGDAKASKVEIDKAEKLLEQNPQLKPKNYTNFLIRKSSYYRVNGYKKIAFEIAQYAKKYADSVNDKVNMPVVEFILGMGYIVKEPNVGLKHFKNSLQLYKGVHRNELVNMMYRNIAKKYLQEKKYKIANIYIDSAIANIKKSTISDIKSGIYFIKSEILEKQHQADSALHYYKLATAFFNESNIEQREQKIQELNMQFELEKAISEKHQLGKNIAETKKLNVTLVILLFIFTLLIIGLTFFFWTLSKNKKQIEIQRQKISQKNEALSNTLNEKQFLVEELNHRVKNNLSVILSLISFQKDEADSDVYKNKFDDLYQRIRTIALAHDLYAYNVNHSDHSLIELPEYANKIFEALQSVSGKNYTYTIQAHDMAVKVDKALPIGLILNELITNSIKHAQPENQQLVLNLKIGKTENHKIKFEYFDNGTVFNIDKNKESLGLFIIEGMVKQLRGSYQREHSYYKILFDI